MQSNQLKDIHSKIDFSALIESVISKRYPNYEFCFFYGSASKNCHNPASDIDLIVVFSDSIQPFREKFIAESILFDVFVYDVESLNGALHSARTSGKFVTVDAVIDAIVIPIQTKNSEILKIIAQRIKSAGFLFTQKSFFRQYVTGILDDFEGPLNAGEITLLSTDLFKCVVEISLICSGAGICTRRHAARQMQNTFPEEYKTLCYALTQSLQGDSSKLREITIESLSLLGGALRDQFRSPIADGLRMPLPVM